MVKFLVAGSATLLISVAAVWGFAASENGPPTACAYNNIVPIISGSATCHPARQLGQPRARERMLSIG